MRHLTLVLLVLALGTAPAQAETQCGQVAGGWNVPKGGMVRNSAAGIIKGVLNAVGEYSTHTMMSHGPGGWVTHETMKEPEQRGWPGVCDGGPLNADQLRYGFPGASQVQQGAIYSFLSGYEFIAYQTTRTSAGATTVGAEIADYLWTEIPYWWQSAGYYRIGPPGGSPLNYSLYQYRDLWNVNQGWIGHNYGMVCSTMLAWAHYNKGKGVVAGHTYNHTQLVNAGSALYSAVENGVSGWDNFLGGAACFEFNGIADDAARQVRNCMGANACNTDDEGWWNNVANDPNSVATSVSPDKLGGWSGHAWQGYPESGVSAWAYDSNNTVQWNQGGAAYTCWF